MQHMQIIQPKVKQIQRKYKGTSSVSRKRS